MTPRPGVVRPASFRAIARSLSKPTHAEASHASFLDHAWSGAVPWRPDVRGRHGSRQADYRGWLARRRRVTASTCRSLLVALVAGVARHQSDWRLCPACGCPCGRSWRASVVAKTQGAALATRGRCAHSRRPRPPAQPGLHRNRGRGQAGQDQRGAPNGGRSAQDCRRMAGCSSRATALDSSASWWALLAPSLQVGSRRLTEQESAR
jgi:hypothetical protein